MNKKDFYRKFLLRVIRTFPLGLGAALLFLLFWYKLGGDTFWGHLLAGWLKLFSPFFKSGFSADDPIPVFYYVFEIAGARHEIAYKLNQLNSNLVVIVTLLVILPHKNVNSSLKLLVITFLLILLYQTFSFWIQCYSAVIGPGVADKYGIFWEDTTWYFVTKKVANFDMFILRYYGAFPIVGLALTIRYFIEKKAPPPEKSTKK